MTTATAARKGDLAAGLDNDDDDDDTRHLVLSPLLVSRLPSREDSIEDKGAEMLVYGEEVMGRDASMLQLAQEGRVPTDARLFSCWARPAREGARLAGWLAGLTHAVLYRTAMALAVAISTSRYLRTYVWYCGTGLHRADSDFLRRRNANNACGTS